MTEEFGKFFKQQRIGLRKTLRAFCAENGFDIGNISRLERGLLPPPRAKEKLERYASALRIAPGMDEWLEFFDLAAVASGRLPEYLTSDADVAKKLPLLFRAVQNRRVDGESLDDLIERIRKA